MDATRTSETLSGARPFRRRVFYIPGYDPIHPRRYRELYRKEGADQSRISGYQIDLKPKKTKGPYGWHVTGVIAGQVCDTDVDVLVWSDIVKASMSQGIVATYLQLIRTAWAYIGSGALFRLMRLRKGPMIAALYPIFVLLAQLALAIGLGLATAGGFAALMAWAKTLHPGLSVHVTDFGSLAIGTLTMIVVLRWFKAMDGRIFAYYLMHDYAYSAQSNGAIPPELETRMRDFGKSIHQALTEGFDEVLVVGHSSGAHLAVSILADLIRDGLPANHTALSFLSLGQVVPMVSFLPNAHRLRADLRYLSARSEVTWVDVTAPGDGCAFALCDPVSVTGVAPADKKWPLVISAAFTQTLSPVRWNELRWRFFRLHFQYLCAFDQPSDYDYFQITAGPVPLADRYRGRAPSRSRIEHPVNRYTDTT
ncbi:MAG: hypothetical protein ACK4MS_08135 [Paracoccaceae bacterium]